MKLGEKLASSETINTLSNFLKKESPKIYIAGGILCAAGSAFLAWRAGKKHESVVTDVKNDISTVRNARPENPEEQKAEFVDYKKKLINAYLKAGFKLGKLYAPVVALSTLSVIFTSKGASIFSNRIDAYSAAYAAKAAEYNFLMSNVKERFGDEVANELRYGIKEKEVEEPILDKNGEPRLNPDGTPKIKKHKEKVRELNPDQYSMYARIWDKDSKGFEFDYETGRPNSWYNRDWLLKSERRWNYILWKRKNHTVFLNEIYDYFGYDRTIPGQVAGWHLDNLSGYDFDDPDHIPQVIRLYPDWLYENEDAEFDEVIIDPNVDGKVIEYLDAEVKKKKDV